MGAVVIVVALPGPDLLSGVAQAREQRLVEQLVPEAAVEAFDEAVLGRLARGDVAPVELGRLGEGQDRRRGELGAIARWELIAAERLWPPAEPSR